MATNLKFLYQAYKEKRLKKISDKMFEVGDHTVIIQTKSGRKLITCDCENHTKFCNSPAFCWHKNLVIVYPIFDFFVGKINENINFLEMSKGLKKEFDFDDVATLFESMKEFK